MPSKSGSAGAGRLSLCQERLIDLFEDDFFNVLSHERTRNLPGSGNPDPLQHLADIDFIMPLVVVEFLTPAKRINLLQTSSTARYFATLLFAQDREDIVGVRRTIHERFAGAEQVTFVDADVFPFGDKVVSGVTHLRELR